MCAGVADAVGLETVATVKRLCTGISLRHPELCGFPGCEHGVEQVLTDPGPVVCPEDVEHPYLELVHRIETGMFPGEEWAGQGETHDLTVDLCDNQASSRFTAPEHPLPHADAACLGGVLPEVWRDQFVVGFHPALLVNTAEIGGVLERGRAQNDGHAGRRYPVAVRVATRIGSVFTGSVS